MKVLVLTHRLPFAPNRGDRIRAYHIVRLLAARADVHVVSLVHDRREEAEAAAMRRLGVEVSTARVPRLRNMIRAAVALPTRPPLTTTLLHSPWIAGVLREVVQQSDPDVVLSYCSGVVPLCLTPPLDAIPFVLDMVDVDSAKWAAFAERASLPWTAIYRRESRCLAKLEQQASRAAFVTTVVNERERDLLRRVCPEAPIRVASNGVDAEFLAPPGPPAAGERVIFTAVFNYAPNADAALWFARHVWPNIRAARPSATLTLAGSSPTRQVRQLARQDPSIEVTGAVADMRPLLWRSSVAIAPIFQSRGVQNKVLEAAAAGLPVIITRAVAHGLPREVLPACRVADGAGDYASEVIDLLSLPPEARRAVASRANVANLSWSRQLAPLLRFVEEAAAQRRRRIS